MQNITVNKNDLLDILMKNKQIHIQEHENALKLHKDTLTKMLKICSRKLRKGTLKQEDLYEVSSMRTPSSYTHLYTDTIDMLQMDTDDHVVLTREEFKNYVKDDWVWKSEFQASNSSAFYTGSLSKLK